MSKLNLETEYNMSKNVFLTTRSPSKIRWNILRNVIKIEKHEIKKCFQLIKNCITKEGKL